VIKFVVCFWWWTCLVSYHVFVVTVKAHVVLVYLSVMLRVFMSLYCIQIQQYAIYVHVTALPFLGKHTRSCTALLGKVKLGVCPHHEAILVWLHSFLTLLLDGGEWSASCPGHFCPGKVPCCALNMSLGGH